MHAWPSVERLQDTGATAVADQVWGGWLSAPGISGRGCLHQRWPFPLPQSHLKTGLRLLRINTQPSRYTQPLLHPHATLHVTPRVPPRCPQALRDLQLPSGSPALPPHGPHAPHALSMQLGHGVIVEESARPLLAAAVPGVSPDTGSVALSDALVEPRGGLGLELPAQVRRQGPFSVAN